MDWFKTEKGVHQGGILLPAHLTYMPSRSCKMPGLMNHKQKSKFPGEISTTSKYADDTTLMAESEEKLKSLLMNVK